MPKPIDEELEAEKAHLIEKGLYVEPLCYPMDLDKFPMNGHEYIHRVRLEELSIFPEGHDEFPFPMAFTPKTILSDTKPGKITLSQWKRKVALYFSLLAGELKSNKHMLLKKFPENKFPPITNEQECCLFCLGSELYQVIYEGSTTDAQGNFPYLSIVLYLSQDDIETLLGYMKKWFSIIGLKHDLALWIYSLLACLFKPLSDDCEEFLEAFCDDIVKKSKVCDESEKNQLHMISAILKNYFCIKAYKIGPSVDKFLKLVS